jgi:hypothetical protein
MGWCSPWTWHTAQNGHSASSQQLQFNPFPISPQAAFAQSTATDGQFSEAGVLWFLIDACLPHAPLAVVGHHWPWYRVPGPFAFSGPVHAAHWSRRAASPSTDGAGASATDRQCHRGGTWMASVAVPKHRHGLLSVYFSTCSQENCELLRERAARGCVASAWASGQTGHQTRSRLKAALAST